ncbi:MAG: gamma-glutamyl-gamma-aminobutyrate hydrolase family protein [Chloroflexia bacterium]|nr:gamma-glutamyl-gamma-aminobutyrate hydrolase family protein [Chloroflexia bacterium]
MGILFVDTEHPEVIDHPESGPTHRAKVAATNDRLAALAGTACHTRGFATIDLPEIARLAPDAIVIGGNTTDWARFDFATMHGLFEVIRTAPVPILGICAGQQLIGYAHGAAWGELGTLGPGELDPDPRFAPGRRKERGFLPVELDRRCLLFRGLDRCATFFQSHYWQLTAIPNGFDSRGSSPWSAIQAIERRDHPVFGVQFHPERYDETYPDGTTVLRSFFSLT